LVHGFISWKLLGGGNKHKNEMFPIKN